MTSLPYNVLGIATTVGVTSAAQLVLKWQVMRIGSPEPGAAGAFRWILTLLLNPWMMVVFAGAVIAAISWFFVVGRLPLTVAYPFVALTFPLVSLASARLFGDPIGWGNFVGLALIVAGLILTVRQVG